MSLVVRVRHEGVAETLGQIPVLPLTRHPEFPLLPWAFDLAERTQRTVYDCLFLALALHRFLPMRLTNEAIQAANGVKFTKLEFAGSTFWVGIFDLLGGGVPHASIRIYAPHEDGGVCRSLFAESWAAGRIEASSSWRATCGRLGHNIPSARNDPSTGRL